MDGLIANGIRDMYGPHFLALYGAVIAATLVAAWWFRRRADRTLELPPLPIPAQPDPLEVAYLRGGANEATRFVVFDLLRRGHLRLGQEGDLAQSDNPGAAQHLSPLERESYQWFSSSRRPADLFRSSGLSGHVLSCCREYDQKFEDESLLRPRAAKIAGVLAWLFGAVIITGLGVYKLTAAIQKGHHNVGFMIILGVAALVILVVVTIPPRLSCRGMAYVKGMQHTFDRLKGSAATAIAAADDLTWPLLVGVFGIASLAGTEYAPFADMFRKSQAASGWSSGCGGASGGCGGGGGGGGGCGGGCGGCGG